MNRNVINPNVDVNVNDLDRKHLVILLDEFIDANTALAFLTGDLVEALSNAQDMIRACIDGTVDYLDAEKFLETLDEYTHPDIEGDMATRPGPSKRNHEILSHLFDLVTSGADPKIMVKIQEWMKQEDPEGFDAARKKYEGESDVTRQTDQ